MLANRTSRWSLGAALLCLVLLAASWFLLISPRRADASAVRAQSAQADSQVSVLQVQIAQLKAQSADLDKRKTELAAIKKQLPPKADIPALIRDLQTLAGDAGVSLDSLTPGTPALVTSADGATTAVAENGSVVGVPISVAVTGDYFEASLFIKYLQTRLTRSYLINSLALTPAPLETTAAATTVAVVPTAAASGTATPTVAATTVPVVVATTEPVTDLSRVSLSLDGSIFVLMDGTTTLEEVKREAKAAAAAGTAASATATTAPTAATN